MATSGARVRTGHVLHANAYGATLALAEPAAPAPQIVPLADTHTVEPAAPEPLAAPAEAIEPAPAAGIASAPIAPEAPPAAVAPSARVHRWVASRAAATRAAAPQTIAPSAAAPSPGITPPAPLRGAPRPFAATPLPGAPVPMATTWRALARHAQYHQALTLALAEGFDRDCDQLRGDDLVLLGDVARLGGDVRHADQAYRAALRRFPDLDRPAFALGVMAFESRHDYRDAASWLSRYLHDHPNGPLATEAAGRLLEAWDLAGETARAHEAARSYLHDHPSGPHRALAQRLAGP
jgi:tetratricopeptide (TPR) repeat protein